MSDILGGLVLIALAAFFAASAYGRLRARRTGRPNAFAPKVGKKRPGRLRSALALAWLSLLFAGGAVIAFGHFAGLIDYDIADE